MASFAASAAVLESVGTYKVHIIRHGKMDSTAKVRVETIDGSAIEGEDYEPVNEVLHFTPGEREKEVRFFTVMFGIFKLSKFDFRLE